MNNSKTLTLAKKARNDEFYTMYEDIEKEVSCYPLDTWKDKIIYCNCDDPSFSNFWKFFVDNFKKFNLKELHATCIERSWGASYHWTYDGNKTTMTALRDKGDFRSDECVEILKEADIVVTNPPFSLFREYVAQLMKYRKKFLIIGNINVVTYKEVFPLIRGNLLWMGASIHSGDREFRVPDDYPLNAAGYRIDDKGVKYIRVKGVRWFTNMEYPKRHEELVLYRSYITEDYTTYDNYDAINVDKVKEIPKDYDGAMGVPITFLDKYNPDQFEILDANEYRRTDKTPYKQHGLIKDKDSSINGKPTYARIPIKHKH